jgi:transketolase
MAIEATGRLAESGIFVDLLEVSTLKPIDADALACSARKTGRVLTVEEHSIHGGLAGAVAETLSRIVPTTVDSIGVEDKFAESGDYMQLLRKYRISAEHIEARARALVEGREG